MMIILWIITENFLDIDILTENGTIARFSEDNQPAQSKLTDFKKAGYSLGPVGKLGTKNDKGEINFIFFSISLELLFRIIFF